MQRFRAYDPPEYVDWSPDPEIMAEYRDELTADPKRAQIIESLGRAFLLDLYRGLVRNRLHDVHLKRWVMQGVITKAWLGTGEEAVSVGATHALRRPAVDGSKMATDVVGPMIRNAGACHEMGMGFADLFRAYLGTADTILRGRDLHIGDLDCGVMAPISMVASLVPVCAGMALAFKQRREARVALTWCGDGAARTGEFHEGMSLAAALRVPLVVVLQNNQVALGTPYAAHSQVPLDDLARGYIDGEPLVCRGNNVLDVYAATTLAVAQCREGRGPAIIVAETGRMGGHATHDESEARRILPPEHFEYWGRRDPVGLYETYLTERLSGSSGSADVSAEIEAIEAEVTADIDRAAEEALASRDAAQVDPATVELGVYANSSAVDPGAEGASDARANRPSTPAVSH